LYTLLLAIASPIVAATRRGGTSVYLRGPINS